MLHGHTNFTSFSSLFPSSYIPPDCSLKNCLCKAILSYYMANNFTSFSSLFPSSYIPPDCSLNSPSYIPPDCSLKNCLCKAILSCYMAIPTSLPFLLYSLLLHSTRLFFEELSFARLSYHVTWPYQLHFLFFFIPSSYIPPDCSLKNCLCKAILSCYMAIPTSLPFLLYSPPPTFHQIVL
ncbi:unnamed protein product [Acanthosepion pharaonis]|uniref:Uncharacterized protein n=1 Tax=Acanthosepion pharaonis TaxID=158019 RepID=A0A812D890_ACAPH|nr:unnamed protein product [Sepia pharaonis]